ncbi:MAG TPA: hypothetical protein VMZ28_30060 [Kofleriaceae bacterium]|nr:hypothetical protein [Kofleriaceae bacterium]
MICLSACGDDLAGEPCGRGVVCTVMGNGEPGLGEPGQPGPDTRLYLPLDVAVAEGERVYVADWNNHRVVAMAPDGAVQLVAGQSFPGVAVDGPAIELLLNHPSHLALVGAATLVVTAWENNKVIEVDLASGEARIVAGTGMRDYAGDGGPALEALLHFPIAAVRDRAGRTYVLDQFNQRVRRIDDEGIIDTVVGPPADFLPYAGDGLAWVCPPEPSWAACTVCTDDEEICGLAKPRPQGFGGDGGAPDEVFFYFHANSEPSGRLEMAGDVLLVADSGNQRVRAIDWAADPVTVRTIAGGGGEECAPDERRCTAMPGAYEGDGGAAVEARFDGPNDVAVGEDGSIYVADTGNGCVRRIDAGGIIETVAGVCGEHGFAGDDGDAREALFDHPFGIAVTREALYVADTNNHRIRRIALAQ